MGEKGEIQFAIESDACFITVCCLGGTALMANLGE